MKWAFRKAAENGDFQVISYMHTVSMDFYIIIVQ